MNKSLIVILATILTLLIFCNFTTKDSKITSEPIQQSYNSSLIVHFIDVGQGDSTFIELPNSETMLIDTGDENSADRVVDYIFTQGYDTINYLVETHPHQDHIGGVPTITNNFNVENAYTTSVKTNTYCYADSETALNISGAVRHYVKAGDTIINEPSLIAEVVAPKTELSDDLNNSSLVIKLNYLNSTFLFTGDAEKYEEDNIWTNIKCDVLKVGHHGATTSTSKNFLKKTEPKYAVISCGLNNSYGHPAQSTLERLKNNNIKVFRTDTQGTIVFTSDGVNITVDKSPTENNTVQNSLPTVQTSTKYIINIKSKKIHCSDCPSVSDISDKNKYATDEISAYLSKGYTPCKRCNPF